MKPFIDFDRVDQYGPQVQRATFRLSSSQLDREELQDGAEIELEVTTRKGELPGEYWVDGTIAYQGELFCDRCVELFPFANRANFFLRYLPRPGDFGADAEIEVTEEELDLAYYDERSVPLEAIAREQVQLSLPMKALCSESCQGLCPQCGANLSRGKCECAESVVDTRWDSLREFRELLTKKREN